MDKEPPDLRNISKEILTDGFFDRAHRRAQRRKSPWNLLLIPLALGGIVLSAYVLFQIMWRVHIAVYPEHANKLGEFWGEGISPRSFISSFLLLVPLLIAAAPLGLMLANILAWCITPARKVFDKEAQGVKWASLSESMHGLAKVALIALPLCLLLSLIGAVTLKSLR